YSTAHRSSEGVFMDDNLLKEIEDNYKAFEKKLPDLLQAHGGKFALMRHGEITDFFDTARDAFTTGQRIYEDGLFSVQEVVEVPIDLGFFSRAVS
ncbi:MAG: hypothetical protein ACRDGA_13870, partial [Bacteroidota bacterium]